MNSVIKNKKAFKPIYLFSNKDYSKRLIDQLTADQETIKTAIQSFKKIRPHLNDEVVIRCLKNGWEYLTELIKDDHPQYPHAEIKTLLSLEGLKPDLVDEAKANFTKIKKSQVDEYNISGVEVKLKPETVKEIEKQAERYTNSEVQNEALETLNAIALNINSAIESGLIESERIGANMGFTKDLLAPFKDTMNLKHLKCGKWGIQPNRQAIWRL